MLVGAPATACGQDDGCRAQSGHPDGFSAYGRCEITPQPLPDEGEFGLGAPRALSPAGCPSASHRGAGLAHPRCGGDGGRAGMGWLHSEETAILVVWVPLAAEARWDPKDSSAAG